MGWNCDSVSGWISVVLVWGWELIDVSDGSFEFDQGLLDDYASLLKVHASEYVFGFIEYDLKALHANCSPAVFIKVAHGTHLHKPYSTR